MAHKYLRKDWVDGKWQYYYYDPKTKRKSTNWHTRLKSRISDKIGEDEKEKLTRAKNKEEYAHYRNTASKASAEHYRKITNPDHGYTKDGDYWEGPIFDKETAKEKVRPRYFTDMLYTKDEFQQFNDRADNYMNADPYRRAEMAAKEYQRKIAERQLAQADYNKTFLGKYDKAMSKAKSFLSSLFKKKK